MKKTNKLFPHTAYRIPHTALIALIAVIGFSFASCELEEEEKDRPLPAGTYTTTADGQGTISSTGDTNKLTSATSVLTAVTAPSFTVDAKGVVTALSLGSGGSAFLTWVPEGSGNTEYRFILSGIYLNFQVKRYGSNSFEDWNPNSAVLNTVNYKQRIRGMLLNTGDLHLTLEYQNDDATAQRTYTLRKN